MGNPYTYIVVTVHAADAVPQKKKNDTERTAMNVRAGERMCRLCVMALV